MSQSSRTKSDNEQCSYTARIGNVPPSSEGSALCTLQCLYACNSFFALASLCLCYFSISFLAFYQSICASLPSALNPAQDLYVSYAAFSTSLLYFLLSAANFWYSLLLYGLFPHDLCFHGFNILVAGYKNGVVVVDEGHIAMA